MPSDRPSLAASLRKPTPEEAREAFLRGDAATASTAEAAPLPHPVGRKAAEPRIHATFKMKARNHRRLKKLSGP